MATRKGSVNVPRTMIDECRSVQELGILLDLCDILSYKDAAFPSVREIARKWGMPQTNIFRFVKRIRPLLNDKWNTFGTQNGTLNGTQSGTPNSLTDSGVLDVSGTPNGTLNGTQSGTPKSPHKTNNAKENEPNLFTFSELELPEHRIKGTGNVEKSTILPRAHARNSLNINNNLYINNLNKEKEICKEKESSQTLLDKRKKVFYDSLVPFVEKYGRDMIREFFDYWTEPNKSNTKMRYEQQPTWDTSRRLARWANNNYNGRRQSSSANNISSAMNLQQNPNMYDNDEW